MGFNLCLVRVTSEPQHPPAAYREPHIAYEHVDRDPDFGDGAFVCDRAFFHANDLDWEIHPKETTADPWTDERIGLTRPADPEAARDWLRAYATAHDDERALDLIRVVDRLEAESLWFVGSY